MRPSGLPERREHAHLATGRRRCRRRRGGRACGVKLSIATVARGHERRAPRRGAPRGSGERAASFPFGAPCARQQVERVRRELAPSRSWSSKRVTWRNAPPAVADPERVLAAVAVQHVGQHVAPVVRRSRARSRRCAGTPCPRTYVSALAGVPSGGTRPAGRTGGPRRGARRARG